MAALSPSFAITRNISLMGPPGSGKGSYGRIFAKAWNVPLVTASDILREHAHEVSGGKLVNDETVSALLKTYLPTHPYILDGFPRTLNQVHLMEETWPRPMQVDAVVNLNVPSKVCEIKLLGRRVCSKCGGHFNINAVHTLGYDLPAQLPQVCDCLYKFFVARPDDTPVIVEARLEAHFQATEPILNHFEQRGRLLQFSPYQGYDDVPRFRQTVEEWLTKMLTRSQRNGVL